MPGYNDFKLEVQKAGETLGIAIEDSSLTIGYKEGVEIALESMMKGMRLGKVRRAEILSIEANKLLEKAKNPRKKQYQCLIESKEVITFKI